MTTPRTSAPEWAAAQATPWTEHNKAIRVLDASASRWIIEDRDLTAPPGSCADGACYLIKATATGAWAGLDGKLAIALGTNAASGWHTITVAVEGVQIYIRDESVTIEYDGAAWNVMATSGNPTESLIIAASDETTALTTGTAKVTFRMPYAFTLTGVRGSLTTAQTSGTIFTVDVNEAGTTILSTKLTIDNTEKTSATAATAAVISDTALADDAEITIDIDQIGDGTAKGLKVYLIGHRP